MDIQQWSALNAVQKLGTGDADFVLPEIPVEENPGGDDPLVIVMAIKAVVLSVELAQLCLTKYCGGEDREK